MGVAVGPNTREVCVGRVERVRIFRRAAGLGGLVSRWPAGPGLEACVNGVERSEMEKKTAHKDLQSSDAAPFSDRWI